MHGSRGALRQGFGGAFLGFFEMQLSSVGCSAILGNCIVATLGIPGNCLVAALGPSARA